MKRQYRWITTAVVGGMMAAVGFFFKSRVFSHTLERRTSDEVLFHVATREKVLSLTIDDGPHATLTDEILDVLADYGVRVTFFIIGGRVAGNEAVMRRMVAEGHELGNHLMDDQPSIGLTPQLFAQQLAQTDEIVGQFGPVRWFRPGSGWYNQRMLDQIRPYGYRCVVGSVYPYDAQLSSVDFVANYVLANAQRGSIIILHDGTDERQKTVTVLRRVLPALIGRGYRFATLSELVANE